jgi:hypothetical protein
MDTAKQSSHPRLNLKPQLNTQAPSHPTLGKRPSTHFRTNILHPRASSKNLEICPSPKQMDTIQQPAFRKQLPSLTRSQLDALEQQQAESEFSVAFDSSTSGPESSTQSIHDNVSHMEQRFGLGIDMNEKPLPDIPSDVQPSGNTLSDLGVTEYVQCGTGRESLDTSPQLGFSFKPGDDVDILAQNKGRDAHTRNTLGVRTYQRRPTTSKEQSEV